MPKTKEEIEHELALRTSLPHEKVTEVVRQLAQIAYQEIAEGFMLRGFGKFQLTAGKEQQGTNPFTGKPVVFKAPPEVHFTPDSTAEQLFLSRKGKPIEQAWKGECEEPPLPEVHLIADAEDWQKATGGSGGSSNSKLGGSPEWIQGDETPVCCGAATRFCGQLDLAPINGPEMLYVFFCDHCFSSASIYQCT